MKLCEANLTKLVKFNLAILEKTLWDCKVEGNEASSFIGGKPESIVS